MKERIKKMLVLLLIAAIAVGCFGCGKATIIGGGNSSSNSNSETAIISAQYDALAISYDDMIYFIDEQGNLCVASMNMTGCELYCYNPFSSENSAPRIIGATDAGHLYLTDGEQSFCVDLNDESDIEERVCKEVVGERSSQPVVLVGIYGDYAYYKYTAQPELYCAYLRSVLYEKEKIVDSFKEAAIVGGYLVYVSDGVHAISLDNPDEQVFSMYTSGMHYSIVATDDRNGEALVAFYQGESGNSEVDIYVCDLKNANSSESIVIGSGAVPNCGYCFDDGGTNLMFFYNYLHYYYVFYFEDGESGYFPDTYSTLDENIKSGVSISRTNDGWYFFTNSESGGAQYALEQFGTDIIETSGFEPVSNSGENYADTENKQDTDYTDYDNQYPESSGGMQFYGTEQAAISAPYDALAIEYNNSFYYIDSNCNLCRATTDMTDYEMYYSMPFGGDTRIIGITDSGKMFLSNGSQTYCVELYDRDTGKNGIGMAIEGMTFTGGSLPIAVFGLYGEYMYYTRSDEPGIYRASIGSNIENGERMLNTDIKSATIVGDYLVYTYNDGYYVTIAVTEADDLSCQLYSATSTSDEPILNIVAADDRSGQAMLAYETHDSVGWLMSGITIYACNLDNSHIAEPVVMDSGTARNLAYCFDETGRYLLFFENCLRLKKLGSLSGPTDLYRADAYYTDEDFWSFFAMTCAGNDWYFFADGDQCGAQYAIQEGGTDIVRLQ